MNIFSIEIKNFRAIKQLTLPAGALSLLVGNNGTGKTTILEAIHFALSPRFSASRLKHTDFCEGCDDPIEIKLVFDSPFTANLPDGFTSQPVQCDHILLTAKKREKAGPGKAFSDAIVVTHLVGPVAPREEQGWEQKRKGGTVFRFDERLLAMSQVDVDLPRSFFFAKDRGRQLKRGFNSSVTAVFEDFNWRFAKEVRKEAPKPGDTFFDKKLALEQEIKTKVDSDALKKSFIALNKKLKEFGLSPVILSFLDGQAPFDSAFLTKAFAKLDLPISNLGSGEEMLISLLFLETLAELSKEKLLILIDEPELHLHPYLQERFAQHLVTVSQVNQVMVSTHSPYFFQDCHNAKDTNVLITTVKSGELEISSTSGMFKLFPWSPSWGEINFLAYNLPTVEFHNELYGRLHELHIGQAVDEKDAAARSKIVNFDTTLRGLIKKVSTREWNKEDKGVAAGPQQVTLQTFIRNKVHHPENKTMQSSTFSKEELRTSISQLIDLVLIGCNSAEIE